MYSEVEGTQQYLYEDETVIAMNQTTDFLISWWPALTVELPFTSIALNISLWILSGSSVCSFLESPGTCHCLVAAGELLIFHLSYKANTSIVIKKDTQSILKINNQGKVTLNEEYANQSESINNGKVKLGKATKKHSGCYDLEEYDHHGMLLKNVKVYLKVQGKIYCYHLLE